tara:strand:- start:696 stop:1178 length:483 start_codon:yes stop_codon:yes gene_type:complete
MKDILVIFIFLFLLGGVANLFGKDSSEDISKNGSTYVLKEAKYLFGGSWFRKDEITFNDDNFLINIKSLIMGNKTVRIPHTKVTEVVFKEGYWYDSVKIKTGWKLFSSDYEFYIKNKGSTFIIKLLIEGYASKFTIIEEMTLTKRVASFISPTLAKPKEN